MLHRDIVEVRRDYRPIFILGQEESEKHWKDFIPHSSFLELLDKLLKALEDKSKKRTSLWLQGSYGVGKTHACSVIAHLLHDHRESIEDYVENITDTRLKQYLKNFRSSKRYLPVFMTGTSSAPSLDYMDIYIKKAIEERLKEEGIKPPVLPHELDLIIEDIEKEEDDKLLAEITKYESKEKLIEDLRKNPPDGDALKACYEYFRKKGKHYIVELKEWLKEVNKNLKHAGYDGIILIWDEFTQVLDQGPRYLEKVQTLLAENPEFFLIVVTHRTSEQYRRYFDEEVFRKIQDRFVHHQLQLVENISFEILKRALVRKQGWEECKEKAFRNVYLYSFVEILREEGIRESDLKELYPIHPFTVIAGSILSQKLFSATRSLFGFLFGENGALNNFLDKPVEEEPFLTVDYLWDYIEEELISKDYGDKARDMLNHYNLHKDKLKEKDAQKVYKTLLILNLAYKYNPEERKLMPDKTGVKNAYGGVYTKERLEQILRKIEEEDILTSNPQGLFLVLSGSLPESEIESERKLLAEKYKEANDLLKEFPHRIEEKLLSGVPRETELFVSSGNDGVERRIRKDHKLYVVLGFPTHPAEKEKLKDRFMELSRKVENAVFVVWDKEFGERSVEEWIKWKAREKVAESHNIYQEKTYATSMANKIVENYLNADTTLHVYFRGESNSISKREVVSHLIFYSLYVFSGGPEYLIIYPLVKSSKRPERYGVLNQNLWKGGGEKLARSILSASRFEEIEGLFSKGPERDMREEILYDANKTRILTDQLALNPSADEEHAVVSLYRELEKLFNEKRSVSYKDMEFLREPPYGLYNNKVSYAMLSLAMRALKPRLYVVGKGKASDNDFVSVIDALLKGKPSSVELRTGSETEETLAHRLKELFEDMVSFGKDDTTLINVRNRIRDFLLQQGLPLWFIAHSDVKEEMRDIIRKLSDFIRLTHEELSENKLREILSTIEENLIELKQALQAEKLINGRKMFLMRKIGSRQIDIERLTQELKKKLTLNPVYWEEEKVSHEVDEIINLIESEQKRLVKAEGKPETSSIPAENKATRLSTVVMQEEQKDPISLWDIIDSLDIQTLKSLLKELLRNHPELEKEVRRWLEL